MTEAFSVIGDPARRVEDRRLVTGSGRYLADLVDETTLSLAFVRSPVAHGTIISVDTQAAESMPGVVAVFTASDLDLDDIPSTTGRGPEVAHMSRPPLARTRVRHVGEPIAVVVADGAARATDAAEQVWADIDELPPVLDPERAATATPLFDGGDNVVGRSELAEGPMSDGVPEVSSTVTVFSPRLSPLSIETLGVLVEPSGDDLHVWCGHQAAHRLRRQLAGVLGMEGERIRVTVPDVGGGFGMKGMFYPEYVVASAVAFRLRRKVAWIQSRREQFTAGTHGRGMRHRVTMEGDRTGRITRLHIDLLADIGAYPHNGSQIPMFARLVASGLYDIPRVEMTVTEVVTNGAPIGSYRGAGRPEAALAIERAIDAFAREAGLDPAQVRLDNAIGELPYTTATGAVYDSGDYAGALNAALEMLDIVALRAEQARRRRDGENPIGIGFGFFVERAGGSPSQGEYARVEVDPQREAVVVRTGSTDTGQGHETTWRQVAASVFGDVSVAFHAKDTADVADGVGTFASRSVQVGASATLRVARRVWEEARRRAAERLEAAPEDLRYESGCFSVVGVPESEIGIFELCEVDELADEEMWVPGAQTFPYGAHAAVVEIDRETGEVTVLAILAVDDCGAVVNPMLVEGQIHGSIAQGLGAALFEEIRYDAGGQPLTASLMDYPVPRAADFVEPTTARLEHPAPSNPLGAKGAGEAGSIGVPAAVLNAVIDALDGHRAGELQLPLRPERVWNAMQEASRG